MADPSDILSAEQLEATVATVNGIKFGVSTLQARAIDRILRHLRALAATADGEALGRSLYERMGASQVAFYEMRAIRQTVPPWDQLDAPARALYITEAIHLHAIGHAAGVAKGEGEVAALRASFDRLSRDHETVCREASADRRALEAAQAVCDDRKTTIARLTAEIERREQDRAEGVADIDRLRGHLDLDMLASVNECADEGARLRREVERLTTELADRDARIASVRECNEEERAALQAEIEQGNSMIASAIADRATARADGAREERKAIVKQVRHWAAHGRDGMPVIDGDTSLVDWIATEIADSADERARGGR